MNHVLRKIQAQWFIYIAASARSNSKHTDATKCQVFGTPVSDSVLFHLEKRQSLFLCLFFHSRKRDYTRTHWQTVSALWFYNFFSYARLACSALLSSSVSLILHVVLPSCPPIGMSFSSHHCWHPKQSMVVTARQLTTCSAYSSRKKRINNQMDTDIFRQCSQRSPSSKLVSEQRFGVDSSRFSNPT